VLNRDRLRANFFIQLFQSLLELGTALAGWRSSSRTRRLWAAGAGRDAGAGGVYFLVGGIISLVIQPGMSALIDSVRDGTLDFTLTKPEDAQLLVSIQRVAIWSLLDLLMGIGVLVTAWPAGENHRVGRQPGLSACYWPGHDRLQFLADPGEPVVWLVRVETCS